MRALTLACFFLFFAGAVRAADRDDLQPFLSQWGQPNWKDSTEYDRPRPPFVTKFLVYNTRSIRLRAVFLALPKHLGDPPPYAAWRLLGFQNAKTNAVVDASTARDLLQGRRATH